MTTLRVGLRIKVVAVEASSSKWGVHPYTSFKVSLVSGRRLVIGGWWLWLAGVVVVEAIVKFKVRQGV